MRLYWPPLNVIVRCYDSVVMESFIFYTDNVVKLTKHSSLYNSSARTMEGIFLTDVHGPTTIEPSASDH